MKPLTYSILALSLLVLEAYGGDTTNAPSYTNTAYVSLFPNDSVTNKIAKELKWTMYYARPTTDFYAKYNHEGTALNCLQFAYRIKDIDKDAEIWQTGGQHAIAIVTDEKGKRIAYSNGRVVRESAYVKVKKIK